MKNLETISEESTERRVDESELFLTEARKVIARVHGELPKTSHFKTSTGKEYWDVSVYDYFDEGLVDQKVIAKLMEGGMLLVVGTGLGKLEKVLWKGYNIPAEQISIADIELNQEIESLPFNKFEFDLTKKWPLLRKFDFIFFPESFGVAAHNAIGALSFDEIEREEIFGKNKKREGMVIKKLQIIYEILLHLNDGGEVRLIGDLLSEYEVKRIREELEKKYPEISVLRQKSGLLIIKLDIK